MAFRLLAGCAFVRPQTEQNSSLCVSIISDEHAEMFGMYAFRIIEKVWGSTSEAQPTI
jgi:hypothetical protein